MAIYHLSVKTISRSAGRSATAAAAYRAGAKITDERTGEIHDYTRKGGVESAALILPDNAPEWARDRAQLWNAAEQAETRKNSTVAREFEVALPEELTPGQRQQLAHDFARELVARHGMAADVAIHAPGREGDNRNHHAHILLTTRRLEADGFGQKTRDLDDQKTGKVIVTEWRERFATLQNERLREAGHTVQVDHRSLEAQGIEREATRHLGPTAAAIERRTGQPSRKRQDWQQEAAERLERARAAGELERQGKAADRSIIDLSEQLETAKAERKAEMLADFNREVAAQIAAQKAQIAARRAAEVPPVPTPTPAADRTPQAPMDPAEAERQRIARMTAEELGDEIHRRKLPSVDSLVALDPAVAGIAKQRQELEKRISAGKARWTEAKRERDEWRAAHPLKAKMHDSGLFRSASLSELEQRASKSTEAMKTLQSQARALNAREQTQQEAARARISTEQAPERAKLAWLEQLRQERQRHELRRSAEVQEAARAELDQAVSNAARAQAITPAQVIKALAEAQRKDPEEADQRLQHWLHMPRDEIERLRARALAQQQAARAAKFTQAAPSKSQDKAQEKDSGPSYGR